MSARAGDVTQAQQDVCRRFGYSAVAPEPMVAVALSTIGAMPVYGTRIVLLEGYTTSWFIHCGEYSDAEDFYQALHLTKLSEILPLAVPYLGLPHGSKFIIDDRGYEDVWLA
ncbi:immunity protein Imm33 domain-containing protein [Gordonia hydrophobica]|uniref:Imm33-like domain-containing protein n=1 Tax=Gordonia hydrophobica TaxID=40516 RepID=A0ABZ2U793_9ACTN|nr:hypothetical protein [Gordonia hydrophobica]MBM7368146.1 hypothetical protein [Gordonia hydrophobica]